MGKTIEEALLGFIAAEEWQALLAPQHNGIICERAVAASGMVYRQEDGWVIEATLSTVYLRRVGSEPEIPVPSEQFQSVGCNPSEAAADIVEQHRKDAAAERANAKHRAAQAAIEAFNHDFDGLFARLDEYEDAPEIVLAAE